MKRSKFNAMLDEMAELITAHAYVNGITKGFEIDEWLAVAEAMARDLGVIATHYCGIDEVENDL